MAISLPSLFAPPGRLPEPELPHGIRRGELTKLAQVWTGQKATHWPDKEWRVHLDKASHSWDAGRRLLEGLRSAEREILSVFRRHGNQVDGAVLGVDLLHRG